MDASCLSSRDTCARAAKNLLAWELALEEEVSASGGLEQGPHLWGTHLQTQCPHHQPAVLAVLGKAIHWQTLVLEGNDGRVCVRGVGDCNPLGSVLVGT